jgi:26S proteasome regulatory subunit N1
VAVKCVCDAAEADGVKLTALELLRREIRSATSSMTSVPKPLKFLRPSYEVLKTAFEVRRCLWMPGCGPSRL